jgi:hypothetical protein
MDYNELDARFEVFMAVKMEAEWTSEMLVFRHNTVWHHNSIP